MELGDLPDYPSLKQLSRALWREGSVRGAALLVGAGFSKNAEFAGGDTLAPPLWSDFATAMAEQLYAGGNIPAFQDPLRLAEEYKAYYGRSALDQLIRTRIADQAWRPSEIHNDLLSLEWSEVLTTNWDTLLERTAIKLDRRRYEIVRTEIDLALTRSPRIVKLHGTIGGTEQFIVTEEDYRGYPGKFAAFVNFARQVFIENDLCLLGFSGDDPNFLQWAGWVRDHLGESARRIYLVGVLNLTSAKRKFLESRNIAPIDLAPLVSHESDKTRYRKALEKFVHFLKHDKPAQLRDWKPKSRESYDFVENSNEYRVRMQNPDSKAAILKRAMFVWRADRNAYPGWLICPINLRADFSAMIDYVGVTEAGIAALNYEDRLEFCFEYCWRMRISLLPIDRKLIPVIERLFLEVDENKSSIEKFSLIAASLAAEARRFFKNDAIQKWTEFMLSHSVPGSDVHAEACYQRALAARDRLDLTSMTSEASQLIGNDPIWPLRHAALIAVAGFADKAEQLVSDVCADLNARQTEDHKSLWIRSRRAWAHWMLRMFRMSRTFKFEEFDAAGDFKEIYANPDDEIKEIRQQILSAIRRTQEEESATIPPFRAGHFLRNREQPRSTIPFDLSFRTTLDMLMEIAGVPMRLDYVDIAGAISKDAAGHSFDQSVGWYVWVIRALNDPTGTLFERYFARVSVASMPAEIIMGLSSFIMAEAGYWIDETATTSPKISHFGANRLRILIEILARLTVRDDPQSARKKIEFLISKIDKLPVLNWRVNECYQNLWRSTLENVAQHDLSEEILGILKWPLSPDNTHPVDRGVEPFEDLWRASFTRNTNDTRWTNAVLELIRLARSPSDYRSAAVFRLACLFHHKVLTDSETRTFAEALWSKTSDKTGLPEGTNLLPSMFAKLPFPEGEDAVSLVRSVLFEVRIDELLALPESLDTRIISDKVNQLTAMASANDRVTPTAQQAQTLFDQVVAWRKPAQAGSDSFFAGFTRELRDDVGRALGTMLVRVLVPAMASDDLTAGRARALIQFVRNVRGPAAGALPYFLSTDEVLNGEIFEAIARSIIGRSSDDVAGGAAAVELWTEGGALVDRRNLLPSYIIDRIISVVEARREFGIVPLLNSIAKLIRVTYCADDQMSRITDAIGEMFDEYDYKMVDPESRTAIYVSLIRAACVRVAAALHSVGITDASVVRWLDAATGDPLPEVRFANDSGNKMDW